MPRMSKKALQGKKDQKSGIEDEIAGHMKKIHELRMSEESKLVKTQMIKEYQKKISRLRNDLGDM